MASSSELQSILKLLDDENPTVRAAIKRKLASYGSELTQALADAVPDADPELRNQAFQLQRDYGQDLFFEQWKDWTLEPSSMGKLEQGQCLLASYLNEHQSETPNAEFEAPEFKIPDKLNKLAFEFRNLNSGQDFRSLADFLFGSGLFKGDGERYYFPENSNLTHVLEQGRGNPISLATIYILVGLRVGLEVGGCNYPAHFLARARCPIDGSLYMIDCFNEGKIIPSEDLIRHHPLASHEVKDVITDPTSAEVIMARVLRNLDNAFSQINRPAEQAFMRRLWKLMAEREA